MATKKSANFSRNKGARGETEVKNILTKHTGLDWERTPGSGALDSKHAMKGDVYVPNEKNFFCVEVKFYEHDHISSKMLTDKKSQISTWWDQCVEQSAKVSKLPILMFRFNRSKWFVGFTLDCISPTFTGEALPEGEYLYYSKEELYIMKLEDFLERNKQIRWILQV